MSALVWKAVLTIETAFGFRCGQPAEIVGVAVVVPSEDLPPRLCYRLRWPDGVEDWFAVDGGGEHVVRAGEQIQPPCDPHCDADTLNPSSGGMFWCSSCDRHTSDEIAMEWIREKYPNAPEGWQDSKP